MKAHKIVIEWMRTSVRLSFAVSGGSAVQFRTFPITDMDISGEEGAQFKSLVDEMDLDSASVVDVIPREQVLTRIIRFPSTVALELSNMIDMYARAQLPYTKDQAEIDYVILRQEEGFSTVVLVACQKIVIDRHVAVLKELGLTPTVITVSSWGVLGWYRQVKSSHNISADEPTLVINLDESRIDLVFIEGDNILSSRSVGQGIKDWEKTGESFNLIASEIDRSKAAIRKELPGTVISSVILTGMGALESWRQPLIDRVRAQVVVIDALVPFPAIERDLLLSISPVVSCGAGSSDIKSLLNLSPVGVQLQVEHRRQVKQITLVSVLAGLVLVLGAGLLLLHGIRQQRMANHIEEVLEEITPAAKALQKQSRALELVKSVVDSRRYLADTLVGVFKSTPQSVYLDTVSYEQGRNELTLRGRADSTQLVLDYIRKLGDIERVSDVQLKYSTRRVTMKGERTDFQLLLELDMASVEEGIS